jgi:hypothetical protein
MVSLMGRARSPTADGEEEEYNRAEWLGACEPTSARRDLARTDWGAPRRRRPLAAAHRAPGNWDKFLRFDSPAVALGAGVVGACFGNDDGKFAASYSDPTYV